MRVKKWQTTSIKYKVPKVVLNWSFLLEATCNPTELPTSVTMKWSNSNALEKKWFKWFRGEEGSYVWSSLVRFQSQHHFRLIFPFLFLNSDTRLSVFHRNWVSIRNACYIHIQNWTYSFHSCIRRLAWYVEIKTKKCCTETYMHTYDWDEEKFERRQRIVSSNFSSLRLSTTQHISQ